ncbi:MAG: cation diffusion facilitator family transporter, partial [Thermoplasmata archaeon]|nr:cation diffusion facilitator family transporter [Thermoplasmata archaeon]
MEGGSRKAIVAAFFANLGIAIAKVIGFMFTGAASMLAEAIHSFADTSNQGLLILGGKMAKKERSKEHPFGYGRERYFWSFIVAMIIFSLGSLFAIYEGISKLIHPHELEDHFLAIGILAIAIVLEMFSLRIAVIESKKAKGDMTWWEFIRKSKVPELPVVLLEDIGALIGLVLALVGIGLAMITGDPAFDAMG